MTRIVIVGGGPAGYEAALVAAQFGAAVTLVERQGVGGACVLYDCVPSKTFIATSGTMTSFRNADKLGIDLPTGSAPTIDAATVHTRVSELAQAQSQDIRNRVVGEGVRVIAGVAAFADPAEQVARREHVIAVAGAEGSEVLHADIVLIATGAMPRILPGAEPDGDRVLTWRQVYDLPELPEHLIVVGSGVTGAEFASAYNEMGVRVTLVSSRDRVLPGEDADAGQLLEEVFVRRGMSVLSRSRAATVARHGDGVQVELTDGRVLAGSHALMTVGSVPNTGDLDLGNVGVDTDKRGFIGVDRVSRTNVSGVYAAGDCTGLLMLASVAAMQGRIAMWHALGEAVEPLRLKTVAANVFTHPEIATVGLQQTALQSTGSAFKTITLPLRTNPRAKMAGFNEGFVKIFCTPNTGRVIGAVVVAPYASELIMPLTMAVQNNLTVNQIAHTFSVYPSLTGSVTEAARQLMAHGELD